MLLNSAAGAGIVPFLLSVQDALIPARLDVSNGLLGERGQGNRREVLGREEETEMRNERELEAVHTVGPPGIYDACRRTINANAPKSATASRSTLGRVFGHFGRENKNDPSCLLIA